MTDQIPLDRNAQDGASPSEQTNQTVGPVKAPERLYYIDALRGFAIFGILVVNMLAFSGASRGAYNLGWDDPLDRYFILASEFFIRAKFYSIFSFLFGWGIALQMSRAQERKAPYVRITLRRLFVLLVIGVIHANLIWAGDILTTYALFGFILLLFHRRSGRVLLLTAMLLLLLSVLLVWPGGMMDTFRQWYGDLFSFLPEQPFDLSIVGSGTYKQITQLRINQFLGGLSNSLFFFGNVFAMMLLGFYAGKRRFFRDLDQHLGTMRRILVVGLVAGIILNGLFVLASWWLAHSWPTWPPASYGRVIRIAARTFGAPAMSLFYISLFAILYRREGWPRRLAPLAAAGRMALSNYLMQSVVVTLIFYSYGLKLYGRISPLFGLVLTVLIFLGQIHFSKWWLERYRFGPAEWLWRSLTYGRWQALRRRKGADLLWPARAWTWWRRRGFWGYLGTMALVAITAIIIYQVVNRDEAALILSVDGGAAPTPTPIIPPPTHSPTTAQGSPEIARLPHTQLLPNLKPVDRTPSPAAARGDLVALTDRFDASKALNHIKILASTPFGGRAAGSPGGLLAADYIAGQFASFGLQPAGDNASAGGEDAFFHSFPLTALAMGESSLAVGYPDGRLIDDYQPYLDYAPLVNAYAGPGQTTGPVIWVNQCQSEDFEGSDVLGAILLCRPLSALDASRQALEHGAAGLLLMDSSQMADVFLPPREVWLPEPLSVPTLLISADVLDDLLQASAKTAADLSITFAPFELGSQVTLSVDLAGFEACPDGQCQGQNVLAALPGRDPAFADQLVILGAHYDGLGQTSGVLWPGANDNASGVAVLLEIARSWQESGFVPSRTVLFAAWDAGQEQALGVEAYLTRPWFPLDKTVAVLQLDGLGASDAFLTVGGPAGLARSLVLAASTVGYTTTVKDDLPGDHNPFQEVGVLANALTGPRETTQALTGRPDDSIQIIELESLAAGGRIAHLALLGAAEGEPALLRLLNRREQAAADQDITAFLATSAPSQEPADRRWLSGLGTYDLLHFQIQASELSVAGHRATGKVAYSLIYQVDGDNGQAGEVITDTLRASLDGTFTYGDDGWTWSGANLDLAEEAGYLAVAVPPGASDSASAVQAAIADQYQAITSLLGIEDRSPATVYLYPSPESLRANIALSLPGPTPSWVEPGGVHLLHSDEITQSSRLSTALSQLVLTKSGLTEPAAPWLWNGLDSALQEALNPAAGPAFSLAELQVALDNPEQGNQVILDWATVVQLSEELGWSGLGQLVVDMGDRCAGRCQEPSDLDMVLLTTLGIDSASLVSSWQTTWKERLGSIQIRLDRTLAQRSEAILARDLPAFLNGLDEEQPFLVAEELRFFEDLARYPATAFALEATPLSLEADGSLLAIVDRAYEFGGQTRNERFPIRFTSRGDRLLWAGTPFEKLAGREITLLYPAMREEMAQDLLAMAEELSARITADLDLEDSNLLVASDTSEEIERGATIKLYLGQNSYFSSLPPSLSDSEWSQGWTADDSSIKLLLGASVNEPSLRSQLINLLTRQRLYQIGLKDTWLLEGMTIQQAVLLDDQQTEEWLAEALRPVWREVLRGGEVRLLEAPSRNELSVLGWQAFTSQAWDLVRYIELEYGRETLLQFVQARVAGETIDSALDQTIGLELAGLETAWAESARHGHLPAEWITLVNRFSIERAQQHLVALTGPDMAGRQSGSPGAESAAAYIAGKFAEYGLQPVGDDSASGLTYFQRFPVDYASLTGAPQVNILDPTGGIATSLIHRQDLLTTFEEVVARGEATGELVYIRDFNYGQMDLTGKIVLREPDRALSVEVAQAVDHGAAGILFLSDLDYERGQSIKAALPLTLTGSIEAPVIWLTLSGSQQILEASGQTLVGLRAGPPAMPLSLQVQVQLPLSKPEPVKVANVLGYLPGADPELSSEVVILGAHYDHVGDDPDIGLCEDGAVCQKVPGLRYPGLNDNASGLAVLLETARLWSEGGYRPARTVLFAAWIGQEAGLVGSNHYAGHPVFPLEDTVATIHLDSLGGGHGYRLEGRGEWEREGQLLLILELTENLLEGRVRISSPVTSIESDESSFREQFIPSLLLSWQDADETNLPEGLADVIEPDRLANSGRIATLVLMFAAGG